ncbi:MAG: hypothetical protein KCHDKBKB_00640 [Elusimicrobia bacterium]|nr:hypothetical protein [Elusimicrobiota bacterium]
MIEKLGGLIIKFFKYLFSGHYISDMFDELRREFKLGMDWDEVDRQVKEYEKKQEQNRTRIFTSGTSRIRINDEVWVNGKKLEKGTPEYDRAIEVGKAGMKAGMDGLDAGMKSLDNAMKNLDKTMKNMDDMFKKF